MLHFLPHVKCNSLRLYFRDELVNRCNCSLSRNIKRNTHMSAQEKSSWMLKWWNTIWGLWDRASLERRRKQPTRRNNFRLLIFLLIYLNLRYMFRATNSPIFRSTFDCIYRFGTMHRRCCWPVGSNIGALYQNCIYSKKCSWRWASLSPETCSADWNRSIKRSINENCCILLVAYIVGGTQNCHCAL